MKVLKGISLFFIYPTIMFLIGFWCGVKAESFFYPYNAESNLETNQETYYGDLSDVPAIMVNSEAETLCADTEYVLEEADVLRNTVVETTRNLPGQYLGMDREQFLAAIEDFELAPPLAELERGFVGAEVLHFSRERVVVRMDYKYVQPGEGFYLAVRDHEVVVYLEDKETVYMNTGIRLDEFPEDLQLKIIELHYIEGEGNLYNFLETYSS